MEPQEPGKEFRQFLAAGYHVRKTVVKNKFRGLEFFRQCVADSILDNPLSRKADKHPRLNNDNVT